MQPECVVELGDEVGGEAPDHWTDSFDGHRADLLCLGLGVQSDAGLLCRRRTWNGKTLVMLLAIGTIVTTPRPSRGAVINADPGNARRPDLERTLFVGSPAEHPATAPRGATSQHVVLRATTQRPRAEPPAPNRRPNSHATQMDASTRPAANVRPPGPLTIAASP